MQTKEVFVVWKLILNALKPVALTECVVYVDIVSKEKSNETCLTFHGKTVYTEQMSLRERSHIQHNGKYRYFMLQKGEHLPLSYSAVVSIQKIRIATQSKIQIYAPNWIKINR